MTHSIRALLVGLLLAGLFGCQGTPATDVPPSTMADTKATFTDRLHAVENAQAQLQQPDADVPAIREMLKNVAWKRSNDQRLRIAALDALLSDQPNLEDTHNMLRLMLPTESAWQQWEFIEHAGKVAARHDWTDLTTAFVASYARRVNPPIDDADRPERLAIVRLNPQDNLTDVVFAVFVGRTGDELDERDRTAAWGLLRRIDTQGERTRVLLAQLSPAEVADDPILAALSDAARDLHAVPATGEALESLMRLRAPDHREFWQQCAAAIATLNERQLEGFALRHAAGVRWAARFAPQWLTMDRADLLDILNDAYEPRRHYWRTGGSAPTDESLRRARRDLVWGDALMILIAMEAIDDTDIPAQLFTQADEDQADSSTEYGGVITDLDETNSTEPRFVAYSYPPRPAQRLGDFRFVASDDLLHAGDTALFHFHFHASGFDNRKYAGPSLGDLEYAKHYARPAIVFTFIDRDTLNADYYQPNGARVDIGVVERP